MGILQGAINRLVAKDIGIAQTTLVTSLLALILSIALFYFIKVKPSYFPSLFHVKTTLNDFKWWYIIPAIFGICIITLIPVTIYKLGAVKVTVGLIAAQMVTSIFWDIMVEKIPITPTKIVGILLAAASVAVLTFEKSSQS